MKKRHLIIYYFFRPLVIAFLWLRFGYTYKKVKNLPDNYIVLCNHTTDYDPVLVGSAFRKQMYYVASEHLVRWKIAYKSLKFGFEPIVRKKGTVAGTTVMDIMRKVKKGARVCMFAEGTRTWDGCTCNILPSTAKLIKKSGCALVTYKLVGGYFVSPVWSKTSRIRRGHLKGEPVNLYTKEQLSTMTEAEIYEAIINDLHEDAYERQQKEMHRYRGLRRAEKLEKLMFICPKCGARDKFTSRKDKVSCGNCDYELQYDVYGMLNNGMHRTVKEFSDWQNEQVAKDVKAGLSYTAEYGTVDKIVGHEATRVSEGGVSIDREALCCGDLRVELKDILDLEIHGNDAIVFSTAYDYYELIPHTPSNAIKFVLYYNECIKNLENCEDK
jgi:1-acyl-sn-glycerol-3-phosphate acyltransferase